MICVLVVPAKSLRNVMAPNSRKTRRKQYNKLVRDNIPEYIRGQGGSPVTHIAGTQEYWQKLKEKLTEEVTEFIKAETVEELADVYEVLDAITGFKKFNGRTVRKAQKKKAATRGGFKKRIILDIA